MTVPYYQDNAVSVHHADCVDILRSLSESSIDAVVTDPPYGLSQEPDMAEVMKHWLDGDDYKHRGKGFMGKSWDSFVPGPSIWRECHRVLKPGGHLLSFAGSRTFDLMTLSIRLAGFEIRDSIAWLYGSGFPKSLDVSKAIDQAAGVERAEFVDPRWADRYPNGNGGNHNRGKDGIYGVTESVLGRPLTTSAPATEEAKQWEGWVRRLSLPSS